MGILEATRALGAEIQKDERFIRYAKAKLANDNDVELQKKIGDFNLTRLNLENESDAENRDEAKISELNEQLRKIYGEVMSSKAMLEYNEAKSALDTMLNDINSVIMQCVDGAEPSACEPEVHNCTGSCETCGGCH